MSLHDIISEIKAKSDLVEVIKACGVGNFRNLSRESKFRGQHGTHATGGMSSCVVDGRNQWWHCFVCGEGGDVIRWVLSVKYHGDQNRYREAVAWLADYYSIPMQDTPLNIPQYQAYQLLTTLSWQWHETLLKTPDKLDWVKQKWGLSQSTIEELRLGYCDGLTPAKVDTTAAVAAGLLDDRANQPLMCRIIFPYFRGGLCVWMSGRLPYDGSDELKYTSLTRTNYVTPTLYNLDNALNAPEDEPLVFTEGLGDAARAYQEGLRAVAPGGANIFTPEMYADTQALLRVCRDHKYIVYDSEDSRTGSKGARVLAQTLLGFGCDPYIVTLPLEEGQQHVDLCEFLNTKPAEEFQALVKLAVEGDKDTSPRTLPNIMIDECPYNAEADRIMTVLKAIAPLPDLTGVKYLDLLSKKAKTEVSQLKKALEDIRRKSAKKTRKIDVGFQRQPFYAQDYIYHADMDVWRAHRCVYVPYIETITVNGNEEEFTVNRPVHIAVDIGKDGVFSISRQDVFVDPPQAIKERLPAKEIVMEEDNLWSVDPRAPYSFTNFVEGAVKDVDVTDLYQRIYNMFAKYVWLPDERDRHVLSLYVMMTYIYMGVSAVPYLHVTGKKNSGKSTVIDIINQMAFNTASSSTLTPAAMFRIAHATRPTFIIDEAERLKNPPAGSIDADLLQLCNGSYVKNGQAKALRCGKDSLQPEAYRTYGPKVFGSINTLRDTLASRSIVIRCASPKAEDYMKLGDWERDKAYLVDSLQEIRDRLQVWSLTQFRIVREAYDSITWDRAEFLMTRDRQVWMPLIAIADVVSRSWGHDISRILLKLAKDKVEQSRTESLTEFGNIVLITLYKLYRESPPTVGYYFAERRKEPCIAIAIATNAIKNRLIEDQLWSETYNRLDANYLSTQLRSISVIPATAKASTGVVNGVKKDVLPFDVDALREYLLVKGLIEETEDDDDGRYRSNPQPESSDPCDTDCEGLETSSLAGSMGLEPDSDGHGDDGTDVVKDSQGVKGRERGKTKGSGTGAKGVRKGGARSKD